uniref:Tail fiber protein n=1 Tax=Podoviridae sp. ctYKD14 TaxID=2827740 RepID=A0A8S5S4Q2_9CAUD|nr:MAG TPA: Tail fiber protein [Podoviridae sp. ctYKD14]
MTPEQKTAVANLLKADLTSLSHQRLIELCILYEAAPEAHDIFPAALKTELERRFTAAEIAKNDTLYAVLQKKANTYQSAIPLFHQRLLEMAGTVNRDIWFTDNKALFESAIADADVARWLVQQRDILEKCLHNRLALAMLAESTPAATAILSEPTAVALWKNTPDLWDIWPQHTIGMTVIAKSAELTQYIIDTPAALAAVIASDNAMQPLIASATTRRIWVDSAVAMAAIAGSQVAMAAVASSQVAMAAIAASNTALAEIVQTATGRAALIAHNDNLQAVRQQIYDTIKTGWKRKVNVYAGSSGAVGAAVPALTNPIKTPENALVFACMGFSSGWSAGKLELQHPGGSVAMLGTNTRPQPNSMLSVDGITFGGATVINRVAHGYGYFELWTKE